MYLPCIDSCTSEDKYGEVIKQTACNYRETFAELIFGQVIVAVRIGYRICSLASGDFIRVGYRKAEKAWLISLQKWSLSEEPRPVPSIRRFHADIVKNVSWEFVKNVTKIVLYPLAIIANLFICLYGMTIGPVAASKAYPWIERQLARDDAYLAAPPIAANCFRKDDFVFNNFRLRVSDYLAVCMHSKEAWHKLNLFGYNNPHYHPHVLRDLLRAIHVTLLDNQEFYATEKLDVTDFLRQIEHFQKNIKTFSYGNIGEVDVATGELRPGDNVRNVRKKLRNVAGALYSLKDNRKKFIEALLTGKNPDHGLITQSKETIRDNLAELNKLFEDSLKQDREFAERFGKIDKI